MAFQSACNNVDNALVGGSLLCVDLHIITPVRKKSSMEDLIFPGTDDKVELERIPLVVVEGVRDRCFPNHDIISFSLAILERNFS